MSRRADKETKEEEVKEEKDKEELLGLGEKRRTRLI
jgi:hypothetical protein